MNTPVFIQAKYYSPGRTYLGKSYTPVMVILHWTDCTLAVADLVFEGKTSRQVSNHYTIGADGTEHQYLNLEDTAWGCGDFYVNLQSVGVEHEGQPGVQITDQCYTESIERLASLCAKYNIDPRGTVTIKTNNGMKTFPTLCPHKLIVPDTCPGTLDIERLRDGVVSALERGIDQPVVTNPIPAQTTAMEVPVTFTVELLYNAHFRLEPTLNSEIMATYPKGSTIVCSGTTVGQLVGVNGVSSDKWYQSKNHGYFVSATVANHN